MTFDALFPDKPEDFYVRVDGSFSLKGIKLAEGYARLDKTGIEARGTFDTPISSLGIKGRIDANGASLDGDLAFRVKAPPSSSSGSRTRRCAASKRSPTPVFAAPRPSGTAPAVATRSPKMPRYAGATTSWTGPAAGRTMSPTAPCVVSTFSRAASPA